MVRKYQRKTTRQEWSLESMEAAVNAVLEGQMGSLKASRQFNVPQTTVERHVAKKRANPDYAVVKKLGSITSVFTAEQEAELKDYLTQMEGQFFGLTIKELSELAFQLAERNNMKHPFNAAAKSAGRDWVKGFLTRNPTLTIRKPESTSVARAMGFNKVAVDKFFDLLESQLDKFKFTGDRIFNCDETGLTVNPKGHTKVVALKGRRQVGTVTSAERGQTVTVEICVSASGNYIPPMIIYPRKRMQQEFETGLPPGAWAEVQETGWMTKELFLTWFKKFIEFSGASKERQILLILDGHKTHTKNLKLIDLAREKGVVLLCLPPHCSHRLQPLDVAFMKPLSKFYEDEVRTWLRTDPGKVVTLHQISSLFGKAFIRAATMSTAVNGFRKTGIWPVDRNVFKESDFLPCSTTDIILAPTVEETETKEEMPEEPKRNASVEPCDRHQAIVSRRKTPEQSSAVEQVAASSNFQVISPEIILAIPKVDKKSKRKPSNRRGKTVVLTGTPYKNELVEEIKRKVSPKTSASKRKLFSTNSNQTKKPKKNLIDKEKMQSSSDILNKPSCSKDRKMRSSDREEDDEQCLYCYDFSEEGWIRCIACGRWAHNSCAGMESEDDEAIHICVLCETAKVINKIR